jgi:small GTP-binding protein
MKMDDRAIIKLQIWDTAGQEQFRSITKLFYKNSQAALIVYDVTKRESFDHVGDWLHEIEENRDQDDMLVYLVGNRVDIGEDHRQVTHEDALRCMKEKSLQNFYETSAKTGINVLELF